MPKKTKKEKIRAERRHSPIPTSLPQEVTTTQLPVTPSFQFRSSVSKSTSHTHDDVVEITAIRKDITKTLILAIMAVTIELIVYIRYF